MEFDKLLKLVVEKGASDLFITAGRPPTIKINGKLFAASKNALSPEQSREIVLRRDEQRPAGRSSSAITNAISRSTRAASVASASVPSISAT